MSKRFQPYEVVFVVMAESAFDAQVQAEMYLNTEDRVVDCDIVGPVDPRKGLGPHPAKRLPLE